MIRILHLDTEKGWRGGENQIRLLVEGMKEFPEFENHVAALQNSDCLKTFQTICKTVMIKSSFSYHLLEAKRLAKYCQENQIHILDAQTGRTHALGLLIKTIRPSLKLVVHRRVDNIPKSNFFTKQKYLSNKIDVFIAISTAIKNILIQTGVPENKVKVVKSAVPNTPYLGLNKQQEKGKWAQKCKLDVNKIWLGNASAIAHQKAYDVLLKAVKILKDKSLAFHCLIAGIGSQEIEIKELCQKLQLNDCVTFVGFTNEVSSFLSALDILAVPSNNEGLGTIILEGIHAGCAVVGSEVGGIPEMIIHEKTGLLVPKQSPEILANALTTLIENEKARNLYCQNAFQHVEKEFSVKAMVQGNLKIYQELMQ